MSSSEFESDIFDLSSVSTRGTVRRKRRALKRVLNIVLPIVISFSLFVTGVLGAGINLLSQNFGTTAEIETASGLEQIMQNTNKSKSYILVVGVDPSEALTDIIVIACIDHKTKAVNFLQIPRDTFIGDDVPTAKINAVYGHHRKGESKINALIRRINSYFGIPIDYYCMFTIKGFITIIDALGGLTINIEQKNGIDIMDPETKKHERIGPGWVTLNGHQAVGFVRKRKGDGYVNGDIDRIKAQRLVYVALFKKLKTMSVSQMYSIANNCYSDITTDMTIDTIVGYADLVQGIDMQKIVIHALPGQFANYKKLSMWSPHKDKYLELFNTYFNPNKDPLTGDKIAMIELHKELGNSTSQWNIVDSEGLNQVEVENNQDKK